MKFKIAVVQMEVEQFRPNRNLIKIEKFIQKASQESAQVVVFPKDCITGPVCGKQEYVDFDKKYKKVFTDLAKKYSTDIVTGSFIEGDKFGWHNTSYYIDSKGKVLHKYQKVNLWGPEKSYLCPGDQAKVFRTKYGKAAILICWDLAFPEIFRKLVAQKVEIIYIPSYWCFGDAGDGINFDESSEVKFVNAACTSRAFENEVILVYSNAAGELLFPEFNFKDKLIGQSQIRMPFKGQVKVLPDNKEGIFFEDIDLEIIKEAEKAYGLRQDLKELVQ